MPQNTLDIKINSSVEMEALRALEANLQRQIVTMTALGQSGEKLEGLKKQLEGIQSSIHEKGPLWRLSAEMEGVVNKTPVVGNVFRALNGEFGLISGAASAVAASLDVAKKALGEWASEERSIAGLNAALASTGQLTEATSAKMSELAEKLKNSTGLDDDVWRNAMASMVRLGKVHTDQLESETVAVKNLAGLMGVDVPTATMIYIRALNGSFTALSRHGIKLDENLDKEGKLAQLRQKIGAGEGILEVQNNTLAGSFRQVGVQVSSLMKWLGQFIDTGYGVTQWAKDAGGALRDFFGWLPKIETGTSGLKNNTDAASRSATALKGGMEEVGDGADELGGKIAKGIKPAKEAFEQLNDEIEKTLKHEKAMADAARDLALAQLDQEETKALSVEGLTTDQEGVIRAKFHSRRTEIEDRAHREDAAAELEAQKIRQTQLETEVNEKKTKQGELELARDIAANRLQAAQAGESAKSPENYKANQHERKQLIGERAYMDNQLADAEPTVQRPFLTEKLRSRFEEIASRLRELDAQEAPMRKAADRVLLARADLKKAQDAVDSGAKELETFFSTAAERSQDIGNAIEEASARIDAINEKNTADTAKGSLAEQTAKRKVDEASRKESEEVYRKSAAEDQRLRALDQTNIIHNPNSGLDERELAIKTRALILAEGKNPTDQTHIFQQAVAEDSKLRGAELHGPARAAPGVIQTGFSVESLLDEVNKKRAAERKQIVEILMDLSGDMEDFTSKLKDFQS